MNHPFTDDELIVVFEVASTQLYKHFVPIASDLDYDDKFLSDLLNKLQKYMAEEMA